MLRDIVLNTDMAPLRWTSDVSRERSVQKYAESPSKNENQSSFKSEAYSVELSPEAIEKSEKKNPGKSEDNLTDEEKEVVEKLKKRDQEVRTHEQAHVAAGGSYVRGGIKYDFQRGPDQKQYAVGGAVNIDTSKVEGNPEKTIEKAQVVRRAALAPADPSTKDKQVAQAASKMEVEARNELREEKTEETEGVESGSQVTVSPETDPENSANSASDNEKEKALKERFSASANSLGNSLNLFA